MTLKRTLCGKTVGLTGAGGFVGVAVTNSLLQCGASVRALVGPSGHPANHPPPEVCATYGDIEDEETLRSSLQGSELVIHLAGPASVVASFDSPLEYERVHVRGTFALLEACRELGVRRVVYISSAEVYGNAVGNPVSEGSPLQALSPYAAAKIAAEKLVEASAGDQGLQVVILRPFCIYGPLGHPASLLGTIIRQAIEEDAVRVRDLRPVRDYCYVSDLADAILRASTIDVDHEVVNVGTGQGTSVQQLASLVLELLGRDIPIIELAGQRRCGGSEILRSVADTRHAFDVLSWSAAVSLRKGLQATIQWERSLKES